MCGIAGLWEPRSSADALLDNCARMTTQLAHRGPDGAGEWIDAPTGLAFGHRRLAIIDLSEHGKQPMVSATNRYVVTFNGEIYNFQRLQEELRSAGHRFRGHSDTEVMLAAFEEWGVRGAVERFIGMFAFAAWDSMTQTLWLARDCLGKKPLYYCVENRRVLFASELKALHAVEGFAPEVDRRALTSFLRYNYVPTPQSIFQGVAKLPAASVACIRHSDSAGFTTEIEQYWDAARFVMPGKITPFRGSYMEAQQAVEELLLDAVRIRMVSDVPIGAFLSGGIDSSLTVALMQTLSSQPVRTFTIGFKEEGFNEAEFAADIARHLGTRHTEIYLDEQQALDTVPRLSEIYDEPFSDSSQIPTLLVSQLARSEVTVALSGDGGDEIFCGYNRYTWLRRMWRSISWLPMPLRRAAIATIHSRSAEEWNRSIAFCMRLLGRKTGYSEPGAKLRKLAGVLEANGPQQIYKTLVSHWTDPERVVIGGDEPESIVDREFGSDALSGMTQTMMYLDLVTYLPDDILVKVDRASMAVSLETRAPLLDRRVVELAGSLPLDFKLRDGKGKWVLRNILSKHVPAALWERPKTGFGVPLAQWLRGPLREWGEDLLSEDRLRRDGFFDVPTIRRYWNEHQAGRGNWHYLLWDILMFQAWWQRWNARSRTTFSADSRRAAVG